MSAKVKGITIELTADASGIEKALKDVNKELNATQRQLTSVNKSLQMDPGNLELIAQKQQLLAKAADETAKKLEALKEAQNNLSAQGMGTGNAQYDALSREISDTQVHLKDLNTEQKTFQREANRAQFAASSMGQSLQKIGSTAGQVADATMAVSAAAAAALGGMVALAVKAGEQADEWLTMSQQIGLSTQTLQEFQYASSRIDVDMNDITGAITRMKGNLDSTSGVWDEIGVKVKGQNDSYRDIESIFWDTVKALSNIENETERDTQSMKIFGKSASELAGIIDDGGAKMRALGQEAESLGLIISDEDLQRMGEFDDMLESIKSQLNAALAQVALPIMEALQPIIEVVAAGIKKIAGVLSNMNPVLVAILAVVLLLIASIGPLSSLIANLTIAVLGFETVGAPLILTVLAIVAALAALAAITYIIVDNWDSISGAVTGAVDSINSAVADLGGDLGSLAGDIVAGLAKIPIAVADVINAFKRLGEGAKSIANKISDAFSNLTNKAKDAGSNVLKKFTEGITSVISSVVNAVKKLADQIRGIWSSMESDASRAGSTVGRNFQSTFSSSTSYIRKPVIQTYTVPGNSPNSLMSTPGGNTLLNAINSLNQTLSRQTAVPTNVNVELVGSAKDIFSTVRVQNNMLKTATGYHALA